MNKRFTAKELLSRFSVKRFIGAVTVVVFFVAMIVTYYTLLYTSVRDDILKSGELSAHNSAEQFERYLSTGIDAIKLSSHALDGLIRKNAPPEELIEYLTRETDVIMQSLVKNTTGLYAYIHGEFYDGSGWVPDEDYDPESRPWYKDAMARKGSVVIVDPYVDMQTGSVLMTLAKTLGDGKSVVALDLTMDEIQRIIEQDTDDESVIARMVICGNGTVVAHSQTDQLGVNYREETGTIGHAIIEGLYRSNENSFEVRHDGNNFIVYAIGIGDEWYTVSVAKSELSYTPLRVMLIMSIAAVVITVAVLSFILVTSAKRRYTAENLSSQLRSAANIYLSLSEVDLVNGSLTDIKLADLPNNDKIEADDETGKTVQEIFSARMNRIPDSPTKQAALDFVDFSTLNERLKDTNIVTLEYLTFGNLWIRARFVASGRDEDGNVTRVLWMVENIDSEKRTRDLLTEKTQKLTSQLSSSADIYMSLCDLDIINNDVSEIKNVNPAIHKAVESCNHNMQELLFSIMTHLPESETKAAAIEFCDLSTIDERMGDNRSLSLEYISYGNIWVRARFVVSERTETGKISHVLWMLENIDEEKKARDKLTSRADKLTLQLAATADIYRSLCDFDVINNTLTQIKGEIPDLAEIMEQGKSDMQGTMRGIIEKLPEHPTKKQALEFVDLSNIDERMGKSKSLTLEYLDFGNVWVRARLVPSERTEDGRISHLLWMLEDIDEEKKARDKLFEVAEKLNHQMSSTAKIYMSMYDFDLTNDTFTEVKATNSQVVDIVGANRKEAQSTLNNVMCRMTDEGDLGTVLDFVDLKTLDERLKDTDTITLEYRSSEDTWRRARFIASERGRYGKLRHVLWMVEDIDKEKKDREQLVNMSERAIAANEAKSEFLSNMSHEIRTPINAVLGMNEMVLRESSEPQIIEYAENIRTAGNNLLSLINDILDFSKIEAGKLEIIPVDYDLAEVLYDLMNVISLRADAKKLDVIPLFDSDTPRFLNGDAVRIKLVITNILTNAVKYTDKGSVTFMVGFDRIDGDSIELKVAVKDTGHGIRPEELERLFGRKNADSEDRGIGVESTGLGISISRGLLSMMGSELEATSEYGKGSIFSFRIRQRVIRDEPVGDYKEAFHKSLSSRVYHEKFTAPEANVLVVDDMPMNLMVFTSLLKQTGMSIDTAESGDEGIAKALGKRYDVIFLDHMMPGKDGIETLNELHSEDSTPNAHTPVICLTANALDGWREKYIEAGFDDYLTKPIDSSLLEDMLIKYLPKHKLQLVEEREVEIHEGGSAFLPDFIFDITEIDIAAGIKNTGSEEIYRNTLRSYIKMAETNIDYAQKFWKKGRLNNLEIIIHTLKSSARMIGAEWIRRLAAKLEEACRSGDTKLLGEELPELFDRCRLLSKQLSPLLEDKE